MIRLETHDATARLLIDRASKRNALTQAMWEAIPPIVAAAEADAAVRVVVLASAEPGVFAAGADIAELDANAADPAWRSANRQAIRAAQLAVTRAAKPTIAEIDGDCIGGGCGLAIACDLRVATPRARFGITPARLGLAYPLHDVKLLVDLVGPAQAKRILYTGAFIDSAEALRIGLVDEIADSAAALINAVAAGSPYSHRANKLSVRRVLDSATDDDAQSIAAFEAAFDGPDFAEGIAAFRERRSPRF
ncbi:MAG: enoyl-CoA hydratase-related protein [Sphingomonadaceae bacterium]|nr:enoyl-CoA hydratase-related protein [Sphingomonadaceae bacterium]